MTKKTVYCLDCENNFSDSLKKQGFDIKTGSIGYSRSHGQVLYVQEPPNECDIMVFNLTDPACFDKDKWGPGGGNDNFKCKIEDKIDRSMYVSGGSWGNGKRYPRFQIVHDGHIYKDSSVFNYNDLQKAIFDGGVDCIFYLNPVFMFHSLYSIPDWLNIEFDTNITKVNKWKINNDMLRIYEGFSEIGKGALEFLMPFEYKLKVNRASGEAVNLITNNINEYFSFIVKLGKGFILFIPPFINPVAGTTELINNIIPNFKMSYNKINNIQSKTTDEKPIQPQAKPQKQWDIFISYASEDEVDVVVPLSKKLTEKGLKVWCAKNNLTIGDSLLQKINEGLIKSRYGLVILSKSFFNKHWPKAELDGLSQKEVDGQKVILPVWHKLTRDDVFKYSPILSGKIAGKTSSGMDNLVKDILKAVTEINLQIDRDEQNYIPLQKDEKGSSIKGAFKITNPLFKYVIIPILVTVIAGLILHLITNQKENTKIIPKESITVFLKNNELIEEKLNKKINRVFGNTKDWLKEEKIMLPEAQKKAIEEDNFKNPYGYGSGHFLVNQINVLAKYVKNLDEKIIEMHNMLEDIMLESDTTTKYLRKEWIEKEKGTIINDFQKSVYEEIDKLQNSDLFNKTNGFPNPVKVGYSLNKKLVLKYIRVLRE